MVFSVDDMAVEQLWPLPPSIHTHDDDAYPSAASDTTRMNRSSSEWAFQRFLQEATAAAATPLPNDDVIDIMSNHHFIPPSPSKIPLDTEEYQTFLKSRLELACAAVALTRAANGKAQGSSTAAHGNGMQELNSSQPRSYNTSEGGLDSSKVQDMETGLSVGSSSLPVMSKKSGAQAKSATSGSSAEQSGDDEAEGETETTRNMDPADVKRVRRMLSNRESARRSRRRKQAHLTELETQVSQVRVENSSVLKRLADISQKYNEAAVDNRVLKADVEALRAKVKMAEETVKRVTGLNPLFQAISEMSAIGIPSFSGSPSDASADASVPEQDYSKQHYYNHASSSNHLISQVCFIPTAESAAAASASVEVNKIGRSVSMQRVGSLEHLQTRSRGGAGSSVSPEAGQL